MNINSKLNWFAGLFIFVLIFANCSGSSKVAKHSHSRSNGPLILESPKDEWRPHQKHDIPVTKNSYVQKWIDLFQGRYKNNFDRWFHRLGMYGPTIEKILVKEGVPRDLIYLAMIESGFNLQAKSHASAVGPWQFIRSTGKMYNLNRDFFMDDRQDLVKATRAAARLLKDLYKQYGDWYLAFAAYNAGPGNVNKAIRRTGGSQDYWTHVRKRKLPVETQNYVPKILAALHIVKNYKKYGYKESDFGEPIQYDRIVVPDATDLTVIAKLTDSDVQTIKELNPALTSGITRPGKRTGIFLPKGTKSTFQRKYASLPDDERVGGIYHKVTGSESLSSIAKKYSVSKKRLAQLNRLNTDQKLKPGQTLRIPSSDKALLTLAGEINHGRRSKGSWKTHRIRRGDTLYKIARRYGTSIRNIAKWNRMSTRSKLRIGRKLKVYQGRGKSSTSSQLFYATNRPIHLPSLNGIGGSGSRSRMSGVAHIIAKDQIQPTPVSLSQDELKNSIPKMVAIQRVNFLDAEAPAIIKTIEDTETDTNSLVQTAAIKNERPKPKVATSYHTVRPGETLSKIAHRYGVRIAEIKRANRLRNNMIRVNQKLKIMSNNRVARSTQRDFIVHRTRSGDTLWKISKRYGVKIQDIKKWNQLRGDTLRPNQKLKIYAQGTKKANLVKS